MSAAPSQPFLAGMACGMQPAASLVWGPMLSVTRRHPHTRNTLHAKVQRQQARGVPKPLSAAAFSMPQPAPGSKMFLCPMGFMENHPLQSKRPS